MVAVDQSDGTAYSEQTPRVPHISYTPGAEPRCEGLDEACGEETTHREHRAEHIAETYFNLDLVGDLNLPIQEAKYLVHVSMGMFVSDVCEVSTGLI